MGEYKRIVEEAAITAIGRGALKLCLGLGHGKKYNENNTQKDFLVWDR